jgi:hypothetical protein
MSSRLRGSRQVCFVIMPFGTKETRGPHGTINFDRVYRMAIKPSIEAANLEAIRADEEQSGGIIHGAMFARLLLAEFVIADLTTANPNVFYELGIRHAAKRQTTIPIYSPPSDLPFDVGPLRAIPYELSRGDIEDASAKRLAEALSKRIAKSLEAPAHSDSPIFELLDGFRGVDIDPALSQVFSDRVVFANKFMAAIDDAHRSVDATTAARLLQTLEASLDDLRSVEAGLLIKLFLAYRQAVAWPEILSLYGRVPAAVQNAVPVRRVRAMALCRKTDASYFEYARGLNDLSALIKEFGADSETYGAIGRVHLDMMEKAAAENRHSIARGHLESATKAYLEGFRLAPMNTYSGIHAIRLLLMQGRRSEAERLGPIVFFAAERTEQQDSWEAATILELAILLGDEARARVTADRFLTMIHFGWEAEVVAKNLNALRSYARSSPQFIEEILGLLRAER